MTKEEPIISRWVALTLFRATMSPGDDNLRRTLYTFETRHPYSLGTKITERIHIPGAQQLVVKFDKRSCTLPNVDQLNFYTDEYMTSTPKMSLSGSQFEDFEVNGCDKLLLKFDTREGGGEKSEIAYYGWKFRVTAHFGESGVPQGDSSVIDSVRLDLVYKKTGFQLLRKYLQSSDDFTRRFAGFVVGNILLSPHVTAHFLNKYGIEYILNFPLEPISQSSAAFCLDRIMSDRYNVAELREIVNSRQLSRLFHTLKEMCDTGNSECLEYATSTLQKISVEPRNR
jgi:hypothetical protein